MALLVARGAGVRDFPVPARAMIRGAMDALKEFDLATDRSSLRTLPV